jgi:quercetin dioxygenase-like cupin family protein
MLGFRLWRFSPDGFAPRNDGNAVTLGGDISWFYAKSCRAQHNPQLKNFFNTMEVQSNIFILGEATAWEPAGDGVRRQVMGYSEQLMLVKVAFETGAVGAVHAHPHAQASYVASGRFEVQVGEEKKTLSAGDGFFAAPSVPHGVLCLESGVLVDTFNPMRRDFVGL